MNNMEHEPSTSEKSTTQKRNTPDKRSKNNSARSGFLAYLHDFVYWLAGILLVFFLIFRVVIVSGPSMNATLVNGDYLLVLSNVFYGEAQRGDIVVACKNTYKNGEPIIKRVIATEGQEVNIDFNAGVVYVDGVALNESYTLEPTFLQEGVSFPLVVDDGCIFVMGDNRNDSKDSRSAEIGQIDRREILGKALFLIFPGEDLGYEREFSRIGALT